MDDNGDASICATRVVFRVAGTPYKFEADRAPPGQYLVLGDNRNNSNDSHIWGFPPSANIIARATFEFNPRLRDL